MFFRVLTVFALTIFSTPAAQTPAQQNSPVSQNKRSGNNKNEAEQVHNPSGNAAPSFPKENRPAEQTDREGTYANAKNDQANDHEGGTSRPWIVWLTAGLVAVGGFQALILGVQARILRRQTRIINESLDISRKSLDRLHEYVSLTADLAESSKKGVEAAKASADAAEISAKALINGERAWLLVNKIEEPALTPRLLAGTLVERYFVAHITNRGRTAARIESPIDVNSGAGAFAREPDLPETPHYVELVDWRPPEQPEYARVLAPNESMPLHIPLGTELMRPEDVETVERGDRRLYVYASVRYYDFTGDRHELRFCYVYRPRQGSQPAGFYLGGPKEYNKHT